MLPHLAATHVVVLLLERNGQYIQDIARFTEETKYFHLIKESSKLKVRLFLSAALAAKNRLRLPINWAAFFKINKDKISL
jgi:hypothetical protein